MSRSLVGFLLFCLLLVLVAGGVVWYVGPTVAGILVDGQQRQNPYQLLQLLPAAAASGGAVPSYRSRFVTLAADDEGRLLWEGGAVEVLEGSVLLDVGGVQLVEFASGADLVQMFTGSAYRALESEVSGAVTHLGSPQAPEALAADAASVIVLYRTDPGAPSAPLGMPGESGWLALLPRYQGTVRWDAPVASIRGSGPWNRLLVAQFSDVAGAEAWLEDPRTVTERAIARKRVDEMVVLLVHP